MRFIILSLLSFFLMLSPVQADEQKARDFADSIARDALEILKSEVSEEGKLDGLEKLFVRTVDTEWIARFVIGKHWRGLEEEKQKEYLENYKNFLVAHYTSNFQEYTEGTKFEITRSREIKKNQYMVHMNINRPQDAAPIKVDYRVRQKEGVYRVIDIVVEGVSLLNTQRSEFSAVIQRKGVSHLIAQLKAKT